MKQILLSLFLALSGLLSAQNFWSVNAKFALSDLRPGLNNPELISPSLQAKYALQYRKGDYYISAIAKVEEPFQEEALLAMGVEINARFEAIRSLQIPLSALSRLPKAPGLIFIDMGASEEALVQEAIKDVYADSAKAGLGLPSGSSGKGVIVAVIDWGFDFTHPNFYDDSLQRLRIVRVWDQNQVTGSPPASYSYGSEYDTEAEILAAGHDDPYTFGLGSHGTHTTGIAAGAGAGTIFQGLAHDADIIMIPYLRGAASLLDALNYVKDYAASVNKPFVFNMSTGSHLGPHDGSDLKNQAISQTLGVGKVFVGSAGNNGSSPFHLSHQFSQNEWISTEAASPFALSAEAWGQAIPIWGPPNQDFDLAFSLVNGMGDTIWTSPVYSSSQVPAVDTVLIIQGDSLHYRLQGLHRDPTNQKGNMRLEVRNLSAHRLALHLRAPTGRLDLWHVVQLPLRYTNWGLALNSRNRSQWIDGDTDYGLGEPSGVGPDVITVGAYRAEERFSNGLTRFGTLASFTSFGPTVDGRVKPDITAPGVGVASSVSSYDPDQNGRYSPVNFAGRTYHFASFSGTSMSGPVVCGTVALMLEINPLLTAVEIKSILRQSARQDDKTGPIPSSGHLRWGWGKLDAWAAVNEAFNRVSLQNYSSAQALQVYPNPAKESLQFRWSESKEIALRVYRSNGQQMQNILLSSSGEDIYQLELHSWEPGLYLLELIDQEHKIIGRSRLVVKP